MVDDFGAQFIQHAKEAVKRAPHAKSEASTRQYLVLPFLQLLGYDPLDPEDIRPEVDASFSDKFKTKVDYAIFRSGEPVIAIETKTAGAIAEAQRGELKGYFNAVSTVKLGILTDGITWELFTDTGSENMMDDDPFVRIDLTRVADGHLEDAVLDAVQKLRKSDFNPNDVGANAKRRIFESAYEATLRSLFLAPSESFVRFMMDEAKLPLKRKTTGVLQEQAAILQDAIGHFTDKLFLDRGGFTYRTDIVRKDPAAPTEAETKPMDERQVETPSIVTTETEQFIYEYAVRRLAFLLSDSADFKRLEDVHFIDRKTKFCVYYKKIDKGRLFDFWEGPASTYRFQFSNGQYHDTCALETIDADLLAVFRAKADELG